MPTENWIDVAHDAETGIELLRAHFEGHAYDPHWHDSYLIGVTEQGVQQFNCRGTRHDSTPGLVFALNPGELHDGHAPSAGGFTYSTLYLEPAWLVREMHALFGEAPAQSELAFTATLLHDPALAASISHVFNVLHTPEMHMARHIALDAFFWRVADHLQWRIRLDPDPRLPRVALRARDYLHACLHQNIGLDELSAACGVDRFRLTRAFKAAFGLAPHAYLIQLRLVEARRRLALGESPVSVAAALGFADQSHMGRWFQRAYRLTPAHYSKSCSNLPD